MEEKIAENNEQKDALASWKSASVLLLAALIVILLCKMGMSYFMAFLIFFPARRIFCGICDNKIRDIGKGILVIILLGCFSGTMQVAYNKIFELTANIKGAEKIAGIGSYFIFFVLFLIIYAVSGLVVKVCPEYKMPGFIYKTAMVMIFSFSLLAGLIIVGIGLNFLDGRFIAISPAVRLWMPVILGGTGIPVFIKMLKDVINYNPDNIKAVKDGKNGALTERPNVKLDDIAGMDEVKEQIRLRMIEPIKNPSESRKYGLKKGGGVMLYGPPGTGKTFIARAVAGELSVPFFMLNAVDIFSKYVGESEKKIKEFFENARKNPLSVVFVDEMEIIFAKRTDNVHEVTQKIISIILQELDGVAQNKNPILLLGATNTPWKVDEAFLRPGRFDILAFVGLPDMEARKKIIQSGLRQGKLKIEKDFISYLAEKTESFSGADINGLITAIRQQAFSKKERSFSKKLADDVLKNVSPSINYELVKKIDEWRNSHGSSVNAAAQKTLLAERPDVRLADVAGMEEVKKQILLRLVEPMKNPELAQKYGLQSGGGVMLYGPPGTGKTFIAKAIAGELELPFYTISAADVFSKNVGESEQNIRNIFAEAGKNPMSVIFFDEMETLFGNRNDNIHEVTRKVVSIILQELDGVKERKNPILLMGATNTPWNIDEAFLRPGRFDILAFVGLPDKEARKQILQTAFKKGSVGMEEGLIDYIAENTQAYSGAELNGLVNVIRQRTYERRDEIYTMNLAYEIMLNNRPASKRDVLNRIKIWEDARK